jgi:hypothetical protein
MVKHCVVTRIRNELSILPLRIRGPKSSLPPITAVTGVKEVCIGCCQLGELGLRAIMIDTEVVVSLEPIRQSTIDTLGHELLLEKRLVAEIRDVRRRLKPSSVSRFGINERI